MHSSTKLFWLNSVAAALILVGCAGGGETGTGLTPPTAQLSTPVAVGTITNFGSVWVNGVKFNTDGSAITVDGQTLGSQARDKDYLKVGMVVSIRGSINADGKTGAATHIEFADDAEGIVLSNTVARGAGTLNVMGRSVTIDSATVFDSDIKSSSPSITSIDTIPVGAVVEVSGLSATGGDITATRIELKRLTHGSEVIETKGLIRDFNASANTFSIGSLFVDFSAIHLHGSSLTDLAAGPFVEVKSTQGIINNKLIASSIAVKKDHKRIDGKKGDSAKLEGVITAVNIGLGQVTVNGQTVSVPANVIVTLITGQKLEVEGDFEDDGTLHVKDREIKKRPETTLQINAKVEAANPTGRTITLLGKEFKIDDATIIKDDCDSCSPSIRSFSAENFLKVGNQVQIDAYTSGSQLIISKLERTDPEDGPAQISGTVTAVNGQEITIGGIIVNIPIESTPPKIGENSELRVTRNNGLITTASAGQSDEGSDDGL